jgi:hypothetical protein
VSKAGTTAGQGEAGAHRPQYSQLAMALGGRMGGFVFMAV